MFPGTSFQMDARMIVVLLHMAWKKGSQPYWRTWCIYSTDYWLVYKRTSKLLALNQNSDKVGSLHHLKMIITTLNDDCYGIYGTYKAFFLLTWRWILAEYIHSKEWKSTKAFDVQNHAVVPVTQANTKKWLDKGFILMRKGTKVLQSLKLLLCLALWVTDTG